MHSRVGYLSTTLVLLLGKYPRYLQQKEKLQIKTESDSNNYKARYEQSISCYCGCETLDANKQLARGVFKVLKPQEDNLRTWFSGLSFYDSKMFKVQASYHNPNSLFWFHFAFFSMAFSKTRTVCFFTPQPVFPRPRAVEGQGRWGRHRESSLMYANEVAYI